MKLNFQPKGLLFDLDGTLLNAQSELQSDVLDLLNTLREQGIKIGLATGRQLPFVKDSILPAFHKEDIHILSGGAELMRTNGEVLEGQYLPGEVVKQIFKELDQLGAKLVFTQKENVYLNDIGLVQQSRLLRYLKLGLNPEEARLADWWTPLLIVDMLTPEIDQKMAEFEASEMAVNIDFKRMERRSRQGDHYYDVTADGVNKGRMIDKWAEYWQIKPEEIIAFGDNANDVEMLQKAGHGVAIEQGTSVAKAVADEVIAGVDQGGLQEFLKNLL